MVHRRDCTHMKNCTSGKAVQRWAFIVSSMSCNSALVTMQAAVAAASFSFALAIASTLTCAVRRRRWRASVRTNEVASCSASPASSTACTAPCSPCPASILPHTPQHAHQRHTTRRARHNQASQIPQLVVCRGMQHVQTTQIPTHTWIRAGNRASIVT